MTISADVPTGWQVVRLGDLVSTFGGLTGKMKRDFGAGDARYVTFLDIVSNVRLSGDALERVDVAPDERQHAVELGDILLNGSSETPEEVALAAVVSFDPGERTFLNSFCFGVRLRSGAQVDPAFLAYYLRGPVGREHVAPLAQGATRYNIAKTKLLALEMAFPPLHEQQAIAAALGDVDALTESLEEAIRKKQDVRTGLAQQLLTCRTRLPGFDGVWSDARLGEVCDIDPENLSATAPDHEIDYISLESVEQGRILSSSRLSYSNAPSRARRVVREQDVLFGTVRPNLKSHALYRGGLSRPVASTGFAVLRSVDEKASADYLYHLIMSDLIGRQVERIIAGSNYPAVSGADLAGLDFPCPQREEQEAIGQVLSAVGDEIEALRQRLKKALQIREGMMQELLSGRTRLPFEGKAA